MISLLGRICTHFNLIGSYYLAHFPSFGEDMKGKKWFRLVLKCYILCQRQWVFALASSALQIMGYFYSPWHFQTETTQGWRYSDWELSLGCSVGPLPPRAACLSQESCCWCQSRHGSNGPGTSLPARNPGRQFRMWGPTDLWTPLSLTHKTPPFRPPSGVCLKASKHPLTQRWHPRETIWLIICYCLVGDG